MGKQPQSRETTSEMFQVFIVLEASYFDLTASKTEPPKKSYMKRKKDTCCYMISLLIRVEHKYKSKKKKDNYKKAKMHLQKNISRTFFMCLHSLFSLLSLCLFVDY